MTLNDLEPQNRGFTWFFCYFRLRRTLRVNFLWNALEIDKDNLLTKLNWCCGASHEHYSDFLLTQLTQEKYACKYSANEEASTFICSTLLIHTPGDLSRRRWRKLWTLSPKSPFQCLILKNVTVLHCTASEYSIDDHANCPRSITV